jgi:hypothetical protein
LKLEFREQDVERLQQRNAYLESELKLQTQHHTNALKDVVIGSVSARATVLVRLRAVWV